MAGKGTKLRMRAPQNSFGTDTGEDSVTGWSGQHEQRCGEAPIGLNVAQQPATLNSRTPLGPPIGVKCTEGRRSGMEDATSVYHNLVEIPVLFDWDERVVPRAVEKGLSPAWEGCRPGSPRTMLAGFPSIESEQQQHGNAPQQNNTTKPRQRANSTFHFAGVFDGHGGRTVACEVAERLHLLVAESFMRTALLASDALSESAPQVDISLEQQSLLLKNNPGVTLKQIAQALRFSFQWMDEELLETKEAMNVGSAGVVVLVSSSHICVANCGDSRAVLSRSGEAYRLTRDHKPTMQDEQERIRRCGGEVLCYNGLRVMGLLAMTRSFGDHCLRDAGVVAEPEITIISRVEEDEFVLLASDGLWDVVSDAEACEVARKCFEGAKERGAAPATAARVAAGVLTKAALDRGSGDNITVVVIDLQNQIPS